jgi:hypothetical protein
MSRPAAMWLLAIAMAAGGCGDSTPAPVSPACLQDGNAILRALGRAPAPVTLRDGTRISDCVAHAQSDADLQNFGVLITRLADDLAERARRDPRKATQLGYLIGAARRGSAHTNGVSLELERRLESTVRRAGPSTAAAAAALRRGLRAGERTG